MKKSFIKKLAAGVLAVSALFMNISCRNIIDDSVQLPVQEENKVLFQPSISDVSRSIFPDITLEKLDFISLEFKSGTLNGTIAIYDDYATFSKSIVALDPETYGFTLTAKCGGVLLSGTIEQKEYKASSEVVPLAFNLTYNLTDAIKTGNGDLAYKFTYTKNYNLKESTIKLYKFDSNGKIPQYPVEVRVVTEEKSNTDGSHYIDYSYKGLAAGVYELQLEMKSTQNKAVSYRDVVYIANGCVSNDFYEIKDGFWYDKYQVGSVMYTNTSKHLTAEATSEGILFTVKFLDDDKANSQVKIIEEESTVSINLANWETGANAVPSKDNREVKVLYPFTTKNKQYIFQLIRFGDGFWEDTEKVIITATADGVKIFDDDFAKKKDRLSLTVSPDSYEVKLNYDMTKLFTKIDNTVFESIECTGGVVAGDKSWNNGSTVNSTVVGTTTYYHKFVGDYNDEWGGSSMNLLTADGKTEYNKLLNGSSVIDPLAIANIKKMGKYWANVTFKFALKGKQLKYQFTEIESDIVDAPKEERITVTYYQNDDSTKTEKIAKSYKKDSVLELVPSPKKIDKKFAGWCTKADGSGDIYTTYDCSKDISLYGKWNYQVNNWNYILYGNEKEKDNYYTQFYINTKYPDFKTKVKGNAPVIFTIKGTAVTGYEGKIHTHIVDYWSKSKTGYTDNWDVKANYDIEKVSFKKGDKVELSLTYIPDSNKIDYEENPSIYLSTGNTDYRNLFELSDVTFEYDAAPVKVTLVNTNSNEEKSTYYHANTNVALPASFDAQGLVLNSWHLDSACTDTAVTTVKTTAASDLKVYAKMDVKLRDETWVNPTTGLRDGHYASSFYLDYLRKLGKVDSSFTEGYKLKKGDKVKIEFTGKAKESYRNEFYFQVFDTRNSGWLNSCEYKNYKADGTTTWNVEEIATVNAGDVVSYTIETEITQYQFETANPYVGFGYNYSAPNNKENYFSDWNIKISLIKAE